MQPYLLHPILPVHIQEHCCKNDSYLWKMLNLFEFKKRQENWKSTAVIVQRYILMVRVWNLVSLFATCRLCRTLFFLQKTNEHNFLKKSFILLRYGQNILYKFRAIHKQLKNKSGAKILKQCNGDTWFCTLAIHIQHPS